MKQLIEQLNLSRTSSIVGTVRDKTDWLFLGVISVILIIIIFTPTIYGLIITPAGQQFTGLSMPHPGDYWINYSRIEQSRQGYFFHQYLYSSELVPRVIFYPVWTIMGLTGRLLQLTSQQIFFFWQLVLIPVLVLSLFLLIKFFIPEPWWQKVALVVILFNSGSDWLVGPLLNIWFGFMGLAFRITNTHVFTTIHKSPHSVFVIIFICWLFLCLFQLNKTKKIGYSWLAGIISLLMFLSRPYQVIPVLGTIGVYYFYLIFIKKESWLIKKLLPFIIFNLIAGSYLFLLWFNFEIIRNWSSGNRVGGYEGLKEFFYLLSAFHIFLILAIIKIEKILKERKTEQYLLILSWLIVGLISINLPFSWKGQMILGLFIPIAMLGILGLKDFFQDHTIFFKKIIIYWLIIILTLPTSIYLIGYNMLLYSQESKNKQSEYFLSKEAIEGLRWLRNLPNDAVILTKPYYYLIIPAYSGRTVYLGHYHETKDFFNKVAKAEQFFKGNLGLEFLKENRINYIFIDNSTSEFKRDYLNLIHANRAIKVYQVKEN